MEKHIHSMVDSEGMEFDIGSFSRYERIWRMGPMGDNPYMATAAN
jgi:hypothetical protein